MTKSKRWIPGALIGCAAFALACGGSITTVDTSGHVNVTATSSGEARDTLFTLTIDSDSTAFPIAADSTLGFSMQAGSHVVRLGSVAGNCTVSDENPRSITVTAGSDQTVTFVVTCSNNGAAKITISTTGVDIDDIYTVDFNSGFRTFLVGPNQFIKPALPVGSYSVALTGVAANCTVDGANPIQLEVVAGGVAEGSFAVTCVAKS